MPDPDDLAQAAAEALRAAGIPVFPDGDDLGAWLVGDLCFDDVGLIRLAESRGLMDVAAESL